VLKAAVLDVDGTLLLSNDARAHSWVDAFKESGYEVPFQKVWPLIGVGGDKLILALLHGLSDKEGIGKQIKERTAKIFKEKYASSLKPAPGSRELVQQFQSQGLETVVASSAKKEELDLLLRAARVDDLIKLTTTSSDVDQSKPDPDVVALALEKVKVAPNEALMLGDTPYDIEAAARAGVGTVAVRCGGHTDEELSGAIAIYKDPADLLARYDESPFGTRMAVRRAIPSWPMAQ
jgi:HAD superfamily hydrolase (TIGR01549 family)